MEKTVEIERSIIKKYKKPIWHRFIGGCKDYRLVNAGDRIAVCISGGKDSFLLAKCMQQLQKHSRGGILLRVLDAPKAAAVLQQQGVKTAAPADQPDTLQLPPLPDEALAALVCTLAESGVGVVGLTAQTKSLEDIFLSLTQTSGEVA